MLQQRDKKIKKLQEMNLLLESQIEKTEKIILDSQVLCRICKKIFVEPVRLLCDCPVILHIFCLSCVFQYKQRSCNYCLSNYIYSCKDALLVRCIANIVESNCTQNGKTKRDEHVAAHTTLNFSYSSEEKVSSAGRISTAIF